MTATLFQEWLEWFDIRLQKQKKKICLLLDNCSAHKIDDPGSQCIELVFLPPNTTSAIQPLDQGGHHQELQTLLPTLNVTKNCPSH